MGYLITAITVENYKRVKHVEIRPDADAHLILLGGKNAQGKSSTMDALTVALGGGKEIADDPVRHGADVASIVVEFDGGKLTVARSIGPDGKTKVDVRNEDGPVRSPQAMLDKLRGARFLDPLAFLRLPAKDQRAALMKVVPDAARLDELEKKRVGAFDRRTEIGRELKKAEGAFATMPDIKDAGTPIDVAKLNEEMAPLVTVTNATGVTGIAMLERERELTAVQNRHAKYTSEIENCEREIDELMKRVDAAKRNIAAIDPEIVRATEAVAAAKSAHTEAITRAAAADQRLCAIRGELAKADAHNRAVHEAETIAKRRAEAEAAIAKLKADDETTTKAIETIAKRKLEVLAAAKLPIEGLSIDAEGLSLNGVPFANASGAERMRVAIALAAAASPELDDVWIKDAAILDDESIAMLETMACTTKRRFWLEVVGNRGESTIEIRDGEVVK